jgi:L-fuconolactonase
MIVDAHHHLWLPERGYGWLDAPDLAGIRRPFTPDDLRAEVHAAGVDRTILVEGGRCHADEVPEFLGYAADTDVIAGVVAWADLTDPDLPATLARHRRRRGGDLLVGVRSQVQGEPDPDYVDRPDVRRGLATVAAAGLVFDLVVRVDQLPAAARAARALPDLRLVLDHLGKPRIDQGLTGLARWRRGFEELGACPNVACKLSGMVTEAGPQWTVDALRPFVAIAIRAFGPARLMFGSDWPVCLLAAGYRDVLDALRAALPPMPAGDHDAILGATATRVYGLTDRMGVPT